MAVGRFTLAWAVCVSSLCRADDASSLAATNIEEVVVTARKRDEVASKIPISLTVIDAQRLDSGDVSKSEDIEALVPGLQWRSEFGNSSPNIYIRGVGSNNFFPVNQGPVAVYQDHVFHGPNIGLGFSLFDLQRVEVLKGPQGTLFGRNSTGGLVNFISKRPELDTLGGYLSLGADNQGGYQSRAALNISSGEQSALRLAVAQNYRDDTFSRAPDADGAKGAVVSADDLSARAQWLYLAEDFELLFNMHATKATPDNSPFVPVGTQCPDGVDAPTLGVCSNFFGYVHDQGLYSTRQSGQTQENVKSSGAFVNVNFPISDYKFTSITAYDTAERQLFADSDYSPLTLSHDSFVDEAKYYSQELRLSKDLDEPLSWTMGAFLYRQNLQSDFASNVKDFGPGFASTIVSGIYPDAELEPADAEGIGFQHNSDSASQAIFFDGGYAFSSRTSIGMGLRWSHDTLEVENFKGRVFDTTAIGDGFVENADTHPLVIEHFSVSDFSRTFKKASWRLVGEHQQSESTLIYASANRGYKSGDFAFGFLVPAQGAIVEPEELNAFELGVKTSSSNSQFLLQLAAFVMDYKNQQVSVLNTAEVPTTTIANAGASSIKGVDGELRWVMSRRFSAGLQFSFMDAKFDEFIVQQLEDGNNTDFGGNKIPLTPEQDVALELSYGDLIRDFTLDITLRASYQSKTYFQPSNVEALSQDAFTVIDLYGQLLSPAEKWSVNFYVNNVSGVDFFATGFDYSTFTGSYNNKPGTSRIVGLQLKYKY